MPYSKRLLSGFLSLLLIFSFCLSASLPVMAQSGDLSGAESDVSAVVSDGAVGMTLNGATGGTEISSQKVMSDTLDLLKALPDPQKTILWGTGVLFSFMKSKSDPDGKVLGKLESMMNKQSELKNMISGLGNDIITSTVTQQINDYLKTDAAGRIPINYNSLISADAAVSDGRMTADEANNILIYNITDSAPLGTRCPFDDLTYELGTFLTMEYLTNIPGKLNANLFTLYDEWQKRTYKWEHQGYEARANFQNNALSQYLSAAMIDKLSLSARIQACTKESDRIYLTQILNKLTDQITDVKNMYDSMQVKPRSNMVRYYQIPGHEKLLNAGVTRAIIPKEDSGVGLLTSWKIKGLIKHGGAFEYVNTDFWTSFTDDKTVEYSWLKDVYSDYKSQKSLFQIFFDPNEGNFTNAFNDPFNKYFINPSESCLYSVRSKDDCALQYKFGVGNPDNVVGAKTVKSSCDLEWNDLLTYGLLSTTASGKDFIKISVLDDSSPLNTRQERYVPSDKPAIFDFLVSLQDDSNDLLDPEECFTIDDCDMDDFTGAKLNGQLLQKDEDYFIDESDDGGITLRLDDDIYDSLDDGTHTIQIYFTNGHGRLEFKKASTQTSAVPSVPATGGANLAWALLFPAWLWLASGVILPNRRRKI